MIRFGDVVDEPARKEGRQCKLWVHHEFDMCVSCLAHEVHQSFDDRLSRICLLDRSELSCSDSEDSGHFVSLKS